MYAPISPSKRLGKNISHKERQLVCSQGIAPFYEEQASIGHKITYSTIGSNRVVVEEDKRRIFKSFFEAIQYTFYQIFLPHGFPETVSEDYVQYQIWDTVQAFCSTVTGIFATKEILKGVGVGDQEATALAATTTWILKDGSGMIGRIIFAWWKGHSLDSECKQWRIMADVLNDGALFLEFLLPIFESVSHYVLCLTSIMKSIVGVAGGATRASITEHQAINRNTADVAAKDGSQETCVNLLGSIFGLFLLTSFEGQTGLIFCIFLFFIALHIVANIFAVRSLVLKHVNKARLLLIMKTYLKYDTVAPPLSVNKSEPLYFTSRLNEKRICGFKIKLGASVKKVMSTRPVEEVIDLTYAFAGKDYIVFPDMKNRVMYITLDKEIAPSEVIAAYFHAVLFGISLCIYNNFDLTIDTKRHLHHVTPLERLSKIIRSFDKKIDSEYSIFSLEDMVDFQQFFSIEVKSFFTALTVNGWDTSIHSLEVGEWRTHFLEKED